MMLCRNGERHMTDEKQVQLAFRLPESYRDALAKWADAEHRSLNGQLMMILDKALEAAGYSPKGESRTKPAKS